MMSLYGGDGDDVLQGGSGADYFDCGGGFDRVVGFDPLKEIPMQITVKM